MDNEMKNGMRELSLDDMDQVSGGDIDISTHENVDAYCAVVDAILKQFGMDVAVAYVQNDLPSEDVAVCLRTKGVPGLGRFLHKKCDGISVRWGGY